MDYKSLVEIYEKIDSTKKRLEKTQYVAELLKYTPKDDFEVVIPLLQGRIFPAWSDAKIGVASRLVIKALSTASGNKPDTVENSWKKTGDLGLVASKLMEKKKQSTLFQTKLTARKVYNNIVKISSLEGEGSVDQKVQLIAELLTSASPMEAKYIVRTVLEDLRVGVGDSSIRDALAWAFLSKDIKFSYSKEKNAIEFKEDKGREEFNALLEKVQHAYDVSNDFALIATEAKTSGLKGIQDLSFKLGNPIKVMLYQKARDMADAFKTVGTPCALEYKYDGFRMQIHKVNDTNVQIFTRRLDNVTKQFPEIVELVKDEIKAKNFIIDCEAVGLDVKTGKYLPFQKVSQRIRRKYDIIDMAKKFPVELNIFDILFYNNENTLKLPFKERREILEKITIENKGKLVLASQIITDDLKEAEKFYEKALKVGNEGVMAKNLNAIYKPGSRVGYGMKIKPVMESLDLVIVEAEYGTGKRAGWLTSFTLACIDEDGSFLTIGKVGTGFKEKEDETGDSDSLTFDKLTELLKPLIKDEKGKIVTLKPKIVIEVSYEEIQKSPTYSSGYALRFPRLLRLRDDKSANDASNLEYVEELYYQQN